MGCVLTAGQGQAPARQAAIGAGCPPATGALTLNKVCGSGMRAVMIAANDLRCGDFKLVAAGGMESMSQAPYLATGAREGLRLGHGKLVDSMIHDGLWDPYNDLHMGNCAEICAAEYSISREEQDAYSLESYRRAREATERGLFAEEIVPVAVPRQEGRAAGRPRRGAVQGRPVAHLGAQARVPEGRRTVTAGNASKINDGAAALVLTTAAHAERLGTKPLARIVAHASLAQKPEWFTTAPIGAVRRRSSGRGSRRPTSTSGRSTRRSRWSRSPSPASWGSRPSASTSRGGAVALGHPIGGSGARILVTLLHALRERGARLGCAAICIGGGEATAMIVERVE